MIQIKLPNTFFNNFVKEKVQGASFLRMSCYCLLMSSRVNAIALSCSLSVLVKLRKSFYYGIFIMALCNVLATTTIKTVVFVELLQSGNSKIGPNLLHN